MYAKEIQVVGGWIVQTNVKYDEDKSTSKDISDVIIERLK